MERFTIDFSLPNFFTIGLTASFWFILLVGGYAVWRRAQGNA